MEIPLFIPFNQMMPHQIFHMISHKGVKTNTHDHNPLVYIQILIKKKQTQNKNVGTKPLETKE